MNNEIIEDLNSMVGRPWLYMGRTVQVTSWEEKEDAIVIKTQKTTIRIPEEKIESELDQFKTVSDQQMVNANNLPAMFAGTANNIDKLERTLMDSIDEIDEDPSKIEQAKAKQSAAKQVLDIQKFKLDVMKEMRKRGQV